MERNNNSRLIAITALIVSAIGLSVGFAAFSNSLNIASNATVTPNSDTFKVVFSSSDTALATENITGVPGNGATGGEAKITNGSTPTITNLTATFTEPGQSVTYTFYAHNSGQYEAFLKSITYANATNSSTPRECTIIDPDNTTETLVSAACEDISLNIEIGEGDNKVTANGSVNTITNHNLATGDYETIIITIDYADNNHRADGDFNVTFGDISLLYKSNDA